MRMIGVCSTLYEYFFSYSFLFSLLRAALGNEAVGALPSDINWQEVIDLSFDQGVAAIAVDGLGFAHDKDGSTSLTTSADDDDCGKLPAWRRGDEVIRRRGIAIDYSHHHHSVFNWKGQMVENHYDIVNRYAGKSGRMKDDMFKQMATEGRKEVVVDGTKVYLPSATFNGIFILRHAAAHFAGSHITLRHLLDWTLFVDKQWKEIDWPFVTDWLTRLGLRRFFSCMNALSIDCFGIAVEKFPVLERDAALEQRVLADILHPTFSEKGSGFLFKLRRLRANMWKRNLVATEAFLPRMLRLAWSHVIRPTMTMTGKVKNC